MAEEEEKQHDRIVLLNTMLSYSKSRAKDHDAPAIGAWQSLKIVDARRKQNWAIEFFGYDEKELRKKYEEKPEADFEEARFKAASGHDCIRLSAGRFEEPEEGDYNYAVLLVEALDVNDRTFAVVNMETLDGREINAGPKERGSAAAHVVVRVPKQNVHDVGKYRCAIETVHPITRTEIETLLNKQLRRYVQYSPLEFTVHVNKGKKTETKRHKYTPRLQLVADVGRKLAFGEEKVLKHMVFTKRSEKQIVGKGTAVQHEEVEAHIELKISAAQGPKDPAQKKAWAQKVSDYFRGDGYEARFYFRGLNGQMESGSLHKAIAGATDLIMCPKAQIALKKAPKKWVSSINAEIVIALKALLDTEGLWEHRK